MDSSPWFPAPSLAYVREAGALATGFPSPPWSSIRDRGGMQLAARRHVHDLARQHDVSLHWVEGWERSEAFAGIREVRVPWIRDGQDYLVALHEIGHVVAPGAQALEETNRTDVFTTLALEGLAWAWVAQVADRSLLDELDWETAIYALWTHYERAFPHEASDDVVSESPQIATD